MARDTATLLWSPTATKIDTLKIDVTRVETHTFANEVTDHPVEEGANVSDHSRPRPYTVTMECLISDTPLADRSDGDSTPRIAAFQKLRDLHETGAIVTIVTSLATYKDMAIESISIPRDAKGREALQFSVSFKHVRTVRNKLTRAKKTQDKRAAEKQKQGKTVAKADSGSVGGKDKKSVSTAKQIMALLTVGGG